MKFWIIYILVQISFFGGTSFGRFGQCFFLIFHRQPTRVIDIFTQPHHPLSTPHKKASYGPANVYKKALWLTSFLRYCKAIESLLLWVLLVLIPTRVLKRNWFEVMVPNDLKCKILEKSSQKSLFKIFCFNNSGTRKMKDLQKHSNKEIHVALQSDNTKRKYFQSFHGQAL